MPPDCINIIFDAELLVLVRCSFMTSLSENEALLFLQPPFEVEEKPQPVCIQRPSLPQTITNTAAA